jgi:hypothetical protein
VSLGDIYQRDKVQEIYRKRLKAEKMALGKYAVDYEKRVGYDPLRKER